MAEICCVSSAVSAGTGCALLHVPSSSVTANGRYGISDPNAPASQECPTTRHTPAALHDTASKSVAQPWPARAFRPGGERIVLQAPCSWAATSHRTESTVTCVRAATHDPAADLRSAL